jgi:DNA-binding CsgD family transcriptional regulator
MNTTPPPAPSDAPELVLPGNPAGSLLRHLADLADTGRATVNPEAPSDALLDVDIAGMRCIVFKIPTRTTTLSPREREIARLVSNGYTNRAIASALDISLWTVSTHLRRIFAKLAVNSRAEMVAAMPVSDLRANVLEKRARGLRPLVKEVP